MRMTPTVATLNDLIRTCRDAEALCRACAHTAARAHVRNRLHARSEEWARQGDELQALVLLLGGEPVTKSTLRGRVAGAWMTLLTFARGPSDARALDDFETAQQHALSRYEAALRGYLPERIRRTVSLQARQIFARSERVSWTRGHFAVS
ncbi:MAG: PA2169 family four-helix-bundle protein [Sinobacteraceae bacterium]|nr:PA2169 family four-helix-bundle protein [Nevskiaceae bacterium]MBV9911369.1 PA2169 family four-helix-bundle protein [Nevskiaceae bacterium]